MSLTLGTHFETFIREQLARGHFDNVSQLMCEALSLLEEKQNNAYAHMATEAARLAALRPAISAPDTHAIFSEVRQQLRRQMYIASGNDTKN